ncbi:MAG: Cell division protein ftsA [Candidatus Gottesmanbacteria bacterium GW2011_GWB1_43_11]|uniref:Cell division protein FtsA n=1 Tax=Candidatus Gottesmanbacteria bacterium GW2011_GWB1_43_11 TaxID=1618446 RepID=A0A0G1FKU8_9BACT|nr:MAG: Cell division protein ftsA [Candidatus Gottesmanbacteria bacterium GW2011_GWA2_42_16]KKS56336.1 MAG: Cell division protein ftsA [Candidatus Gottesmanbacteria bacterium GW2011_GWA1_42_26]KKS82344.1 MAG: Cell division protein ftsA [Candidatus Gottesmanbacteria bacterium GW2011_GWC1_43_10]KKS87538.1 MAG: Cell division protein ftsA [Candidatus Gottesmanbacteria bacterium GW2011_GWB1_43_11]OGG10352.1 MAG: cell division protein FtsA [Candidatus Gottesmanbacteria bacterium RIFCSPHIGHO2_01_FULL
MRDRIVAGIDIGTTKIVTIIAALKEDAPLHVLGVATVESKGIRKGLVVDIEDAIAAISPALEGAERMAGTSVTSAFVSIGGSHISSQNSHGVVAVADPEKEITVTDVQRVIDAAKAVSLPSSREILHVLPRGFIVDGQEGIADPVGMTGVRLEVETHLVTGGSTGIKNLHKCVEELGVHVSGMVFGGLASAQAVLSDTEKELGVTLVDIGGGTTDVAIYVEGALSYSSVIPIGAKNITSDLAVGLRVSLESSEKIKLLLSQKHKIPALPEMEGRPKQKLEDEIDLSMLSLPEELKKVSRKTLIEGIIKPRLNEIFTMVGLEIKKSGFGGMTPSGVVVCGGGAETVGIAEAARRNLAMPVRIGIPTNISGLVDEILTPAYAASVGLVQYGAKMSPQTESTSLLGSMGKIGDKFPIKGIFGKILNTLKPFLP